MLLRIKSYFKFLKEEYLVPGFRRILERFHISYMSHPYRVNNRSGESEFLDDFDFLNGRFIEIGGFDGFLGSPSYFLEKFRFWTGLLIEPDPFFFKKCKRNRLESFVIQGACVSRDFPAAEIEISHTGHSASPVDNLFSEFPNTSEGHGVTVSCKTLDNYLLGFPEFLDSHGLDLLILDVEGYELEVLKGFNLKKYSPKVIVVESHSAEHLSQLVDHLKANNYFFIKKYSQIDYAFAIRVGSRSLEQLN